HSIEDRLGLPARPDCLENAARRKRRMLLEIANTGITAPRHPSAVRLLCAGEHAQEGRLAGPIDTNHADAVAVAHREGEIFKQRPVCKTSGYALEVDEDCHETIRVPCRKGP